MVIMAVPNDSSGIPMEFFRELYVERYEHLCSSGTAGLNEMESDDLDIDCDSSDACENIKVGPSFQPPTQTELLSDRIKKRAAEILETLTLEGANLGLSPEALVKLNGSEAVQTISTVERLKSVLSDCQLALNTITGRADGTEMQFNIVQSFAHKLRHEMLPMYLDTKFGHWLHSLLLFNLPMQLLTIYIDLLRALRAKLSNPQLLDDVLTCKCDDDASTCTVESHGRPCHLPPDVHTMLQCFLHKKPPDPTAGLACRNPPGLTPAATFFVLVPPFMTPSNAPNRFRRHEYFYRVLLKKLVVNEQYCEVKLPNFFDQNYRSLTVAEMTDKMLVAIRDRLNEVTKLNRNRSIFLVGWDTSCLLNCVIAGEQSLAGLIHLAFPNLCLSGDRGQADDEIITVKSCPSLFVIGQHSTRCSFNLLQDMRDMILCETGVVVVGNADHHLTLPPQKLMSLGVTQKTLDLNICSEISEFVKWCYSWPREEREPLAYHAMPGGTGHARPIDHQSMTSPAQMNAAALAALVGQDMPSQQRPSGDRHNRPSSKGSVPTPSPPLQQQQAPVETLEKQEPQQQPEQRTNLEEYQNHLKSLIMQQQQTDPQQKLVTMAMMQQAARKQAATPDRKKRKLGVGGPPILSSGDHSASKNRKSLDSQCSSRNSSGTISPALTDSTPGSASKTTTSLAITEGLTCARVRPYNRFEHQQKKKHLMSGNSEGVRVARRLSSATSDDMNVSQINRAVSDVIATGSLADRQSDNAVGASSSSLAATAHQQSDLNRQCYTVNTAVPRKRKTPTAANLSSVSVVQHPTAIMTPKSMYQAARASVVTARRPAQPRNLQPRRNTQFGSVMGGSGAGAPAARFASTPTPIDANIAPVNQSPAISGLDHKPSASNTAPNYMLVRRSLPYGHPQQATSHPWSSSSYNSRSPQRPQRTFDAGIRPRPSNAQTPTPYPVAPSIPPTIPPSQQRPSSTFNNNDGNTNTSFANAMSAVRNSQAYRSTALNTVAKPMRIWGDPQTTARSPPILNNSSSVVQSSRKVVPAGPTVISAPSVPIPLADNLPTASSTTAAKPLSSVSREDGELTSSSRSDVSISSSGVTQSAPIATTTTPIVNKNEPTASSVAPVPVLNTSRLQETKPAADDSDTTESPSRPSRAAKQAANKSLTPNLQQKLQDAK